MIETDEQFVKIMMEDGDWQPGSRMHRLALLARRGADAADRIEQLEAALRAVMDDLTLIGENHWLPIGLLDDVIYVNARAALDASDDQ
jgi:hypothetical protein